MRVITYLRISTQLTLSCDFCGAQEESQVVMMMNPMTNKISRICNTCIEKVSATTTDPDPNTTQYKD